MASLPEGFDSEGGGSARGGRPSDNQNFVQRIAGMLVSPFIHEMHALEGMTDPEHYGIKLPDGARRGDAETGVVDQIRQGLNVYSYLVPKTPHLDERRTRKIHAALDTAEHFMAWPVFV